MGPHDSDSGNEAFDSDVFGDSVGFSWSPNDYGGSHNTAYDTNSDSHMSWDTDANGDYVDGSGHDGPNGGGTSWDDDD